MKNKFKIRGIDCANCALELERAIQKVEGVESASISFLAEKLVVECKDEKCEEVLKKVMDVIRKEEPEAVIEK